MVSHSASSHSTMRSFAGKTSHTAMFRFPAEAAACRQLMRRAMVAFIGIPFLHTKFFTCPHPPPPRLPAPLTIRKTSCARSAQHPKGARSITERSGTRGARGMEEQLRGVCWRMVTTYLWVDGHAHGGVRMPDAAHCSASSLWHNAMKRRETVDLSISISSFQHFGGHLRLS